MSVLVADVARVKVPRRTWRSEARAVRTVWQREIIRFTGDRRHMAAMLVQPLLFLFILGTGMQSLSAASTHGVDLKTFVFPGVLCMGVMFTAVFSAASVVWDRELGFLREFLVAPVSRSAIIAGKCLGGATVAAAQGVVLLALAGLVGVPYDPLLVLGLLGLLLLTSFMLTAFGVLMAVRAKRAQTFMSVVQMVVIPAFFISGAYFPVSGLPAWLGVLNRLDPLTYAVDPMRHLVFGHLDVSQAARRTLDPGVSWWGWQLPVGLEVAVVAALGVGMLAVAIRSFARAE